MREEVTGRRKIDDKMRKNYSKRAADGKISIEKKRCPFCGHHKAIHGINSGYKCARCKRKFKDV